MATQGPLYPGTVATEIGPSGDDNWTNPGNVSADDGAEAQVTAASFDSGDHTYRLKATNFGFSIPAGATIDGIVVEIERRCFAGSAADQEVQLYNASGALVGTNKATATAWPGTAAVATYGGAADTWTASPTVAMVNDVDFGVALIARATAANVDVGVDFIRITVHYTPLPGPVDGAIAINGAGALGLTGDVVTSGGGGLTFTDYFAKADIGATTDPTFSVTGVEWSDGDLIVVAYSGRDDGATTSGVSTSGTSPGTWTQREHLNDPQAQTYGGIWTCKAGADSGGTQTVTLQIIEDNIAAGGGIGMLVRVYSGGDPQYDESTVSDNGGVDTSTPSIDITTIAAATNWLAIAQHRNRTVSTPPTGMTAVNAPVNGGAAADIVAQQAGTSGGIAGFSAWWKDETSAGTKNASVVLGGITEWLMMAISVTDAGGGGPTYVDGAIAISGTAQIAQAGGKLTAGAIAISGAAQVGLGGGRIAAGALALSGTGQVGLLGGKLQSGALAIDGAGSVVLTGSRAMGGSIALAGSGQLGLTGRALFGGTLAVNGSGALGLAGGKLTAGSIAIAGAGSVALGGGKLHSAAIALNGSGSLGLTPTATFGGALAINGTGSLSLAAVGGGPVDGAIAIIGTGGLQATGSAIRGAGITLAGSGALGLSGGLLRAGALALNGAGQLGLAGGALKGATIAINGAAALSLTGNARFGGSIAIGGSGALGLDGSTLGSGASIGISASGSLGLNGSVVRSGALALQGSGSLALGGSRKTGSTIAIGGSGSVSLGGGLKAGGRISIDGAGDIDITSTDAYVPLDPAADASVTLGGLSGTVRLVETAVRLVETTARVRLT